MKVIAYFQKEVLEPADLHFFHSCFFEASIVERYVENVSFLDERPILDDLIRRAKYHEYDVLLFDTFAWGTHDISRLFDVVRRLNEQEVIVVVEDVELISTKEKPIYAPGAFAAWFAERMLAEQSEGIKILKARRATLGLTQQQVADRAGIRLQQYQKFESGARSIMTCSFMIACRVIEALEMDISVYYHKETAIEEPRKIE